MTNGFGYRRFGAQADGGGYEVWNAELTSWCQELNQRPDWVNGRVDLDMVKSALLAINHLKYGFLDPRHVLASLVDGYGHSQVATFIDIWCDFMYGPPGQGLFRQPRPNLQSQAIARNCVITKECRWACDNIEAWVGGRLERRRILRMARKLRGSTIELRLAWSATVMLADQQREVDFTRLDGVDLQQWLGEQGA